MQNFPHGAATEQKASEMMKLFSSQRAIHHRLNLSQFQGARVFIPFCRRSDSRKEGRKEGRKGNTKSGGKRIWHKFLRVKTEKEGGIKAR
jgi:hypothetical protein